MYRKNGLRSVPSPIARDESPLPGRSTFSTSAPMSARIMVQNGPAMCSVRSRTLSPASGPPRSEAGISRTSVGRRRTGSDLVPDHGVGRIGIDGASLGGVAARHRQKLFLARELAHTGQTLSGALQVHPANDSVPVDEELPDVHRKLLLDLGRVALRILEAVLLVQGIRRSSNRKGLRQFPHHVDP